MTTTQKPLHAVIIGAGICGLATALTLARKGLRVQILERHAGLSDLGAGNQVTPNASRLLISWGLRKELEAAQVPSTLLEIRRYQDGMILARPPHTTSDDAPLWLLYRPDLLRILYDAAIEAGVKVRFGAQAVIESSLPDPLVHIVGNTTIQPDLVLAADGIGSTTRGFVLENADVSAFGGSSAYRILIPVADMMQDAETAALMQGQSRQIWLGPERYVTAYPIAGGKFYNIVLLHSRPAIPGIWNTDADISIVRQEFSAFEPVVRKLLAIAKECKDWALTSLPPLPTWVDPSGKVALIGDAAHATTPHLAQGAAMCIEDASCIAACLANVTMPDGIPAALRTFQGARKSRTERVQEESWQNFLLWTLPDGIAQQTRDEEMRDPSSALSKRSHELRNWLFSYHVCSS